MSGKPGEPPLDPWSFVHLGSGGALGLVLHGSWALLALALLVVYEALEGVLRRVKRRGKGIFEYESWSNIAYDVLFGMMGWLFAQGLPAVPVAWP
ncbi:MAG: hypothetical protein AABY18_10520 [Candidatus Thermoplasmatota archaeon]